MRKLPVLLCLLFTALIPCAAQVPVADNWRAKVAEEMPLLGHRNWILIVDSAYPLQVAPGIETIETGAGQLEVVQTVLHAINRSAHVSPAITLDAELPYVPEQDAPGITSYRSEIADLFHDYPTESLLHEQILSHIGVEAAQYHVLILKTNMVMPYTSVFIRLDCKYWGADAERRLRDKMGPNP